MALDRWIALVFIAFCAAYGYLAFFTMDELLPPFMQRNPVWPSTFPKILSIMGIVVGLIVLFGLEHHETKDSEPDAAEINYRRLHEYNLGQALALIHCKDAHPPRHERRLRAAHQLLRSRKLGMPLRHLRLELHQLDPQVR